MKNDKAQHAVAYLEAGMNSSGLFGIDHNDLTQLILPYLRSLERRLKIDPEPFQKAAREQLAAEREATAKAFEQNVVRFQREDALRGGRC